jgi:hypothetical protein
MTQVSILSLFLEEDERSELFSNAIVLLGRSMLLQSKNKPALYKTVQKVARSGSKK